MLHPMGIGDVAVARHVVRVYEFEVQFIDEHDAVTDRCLLFGEHAIMFAWAVTRPGGEHGQT